MIYEVKYVLLLYIGHHFNFGNEDYPNQLTTVNNQTYTDPHLKNEANSIKKLDPQALRASHWSFGNSNLEPDKEHFATTYGLAMKPKENCKVDPIPASTFKSSFSITGTYPNTYSTESRSNFIPVNNKMDPEEFKQMQKVVKDIRSSHFELGEMQNDYGTTTGNSYKFDPQTAKNARGTLDRALINDLRATHYKLGYNPMCNTTTHRATYVPFKVDFKNAKAPTLRKSHFVFGNTNNPIQDGKTIYMTDYVPKPLPVEEDDSD